MQHKGTVTLETERLILRRFSMEDVPLAYKNWMSDPRVTVYLQWEPHANTDVTREVIGGWVESYARPDFYQWTIVPKDFGQPIGSIGIVSGNDETDMLHVGYCISADWWHRAITSEALDAMLDYLFGEVGAQRIESQHDPLNPNSGRVMKKCGMKYEGTLRRAFMSNHGLVDACYHSILRDEWMEMKNKLKAER